MRYTVLKKRSGEVMVIDNVKFRLMHLRRRIFAWAKVTQKLVGEGKCHMTMYGLTYDTAGTLVEPAEWEVGDIREFMLRLRARMGKRLLAYAWVAEKQKRGVIHYHVVIVHTGRAPMPDRAYVGKDASGHVRNFKRMWEKGNSHSDFKVRSPFYLAEYVGKEYQKDFDTFPVGAHAWAVWISDDALKMDLRFESLDKFKRQLFYEALENSGGVGFREAWSEMKEMERLRKLSDQDLGQGWKYFGQAHDAGGLASWGITDQMLQERMIVRVTVAAVAS